MFKTVIIFWLLALFYLNQSAQAQINEDNESIVQVDLGDGNQILLREHQLRFTLKNNIEQISDLNKIISDINATLKALSDTLDPYLAYKIIYKLSVEDQATLETHLVQKERLYQTEGAQQGQPIKQTPDSLIIRYTSFDLVLIVKDLQELDKLENRPLDGYINALQQDFENLPKRYHRNYIEMDYKAEDNRLERTRNRVISLDYLEITPEASLSIIRDRIVPTASVFAGVYLNRFSIGLRLETQFLFEENEEGKYKVLNNNFVGGQIGFHLGPNGVFPSGWLNLSFDLLVGRSGNFYDEDTFRISLDIPVAKSRIKLSPQWYFSPQGDGFLGFKIGVGF